MTFDDLWEMYVELHQKYGKDSYKHISQLLKDAKERHRRDFFERKPDGDHEQSWRSFKGKNFEKLIQRIITESVEDLGMKVVNGNRLERSRNLSEELSTVKNNLMINYDEFGLHLPDVDIVVYKPETLRIVAVISSKITLRERIAQTGYWKLKLLAYESTEHIKVYFVTPDEDGAFRASDAPKKGRAIVETELDCTYVLTDADFEQSGKVKLFEHFIADLKRLSES